MRDETILTHKMMASMTLAQGWRERTLNIAQVCAGPGGGGRAILGVACAYPKRFPDASLVQVFKITANREQPMLKVKVDTRNYKHVSVRLRSTGGKLL